MCYCAADSGAEYCDERVCLSVCLPVHDQYLRNYASDLYEISMHVLYGRCSVLVWRRSDTFDCTDDVKFAHKPRLLDVAAQPKRSAHAALGLAINCAQ